MKSEEAKIKILKLRIFRNLISNYYNIDDEYICNNYMSTYYNYIISFEYIIFRLNLPQIQPTYGLHKIFLGNLYNNIRGSLESHPRYIYLPRSKRSRALLSQKLL